MDRHLPGRGLYRGGGRPDGGCTPFPVPRLGHGTWRQQGNPGTDCGRRRVHPRRHRPTDPACVPAVAAGDLLNLWLDHLGQAIGASQTLKGNLFTEEKSELKTKEMRLFSRAPLDCRISRRKTRAATTLRSGIRIFERKSSGFKTILVIKDRSHQI